MSVMQYQANAPCGQRATARIVQRGFSLFEVLIAALVLGVAVLGFAGLQVRALGSTGESAFRTQAAVLAADLAERIRMADTGDAASTLVPEVFPQAHLAYLVPSLWTTPGLPAQGSWANWTTTNTNSCYFTAIAAAGTPAAAGCTEQQMVAATAMEMRYLADQLLPQGTVAVRDCPSPPGGTCIHLGWRGKNAVLTAVATTDPGCEIGVINNNCLSMRVFF